MTFAALMNVSDAKVSWLQQSRVLGAAIMPLLNALVIENQLFLRLHHAPTLYQSGTRYREEPPTIVTFSDGTVRPVEEFASAAIVLGRLWGDCFPEGTLVLTDSYDTVPIERVEVGQRIWGLDKWVDVEATVARGMKSVDAVHMNNGSTMLLTPEHKVSVRTCPKHPKTWYWGNSRHEPCECPESTVMKLPVGELLPSMILSQPKRLPFGGGPQVITNESWSNGDKSEADLAYLDGLYISDGWSDKSSRFCISGKDGFPKEEQKAEVERIAKTLGLNTRQHERYIAINDEELTFRMRAMGLHSPEKHALSLNLSEASARALLRGIMADSGQNSNGGRTFTTTSKTLCVQTRVLSRMLGIDTSYRYIENHGGLGKHPIHRLGVREPLEKAGKYLRVKEITRGVATLPCHDIQTSDNYVYLPEHDVTVNQCDDLAPFRCAELRNRGEQATIRLQWKKQASGRKLYHVVLRRPPNIPDFNPNFMVRVFTNVQGRKVCTSIIEDPSRALGMPSSMAVMHRDAYLA